MSHRKKNKHHSRHRTHAVKPASLVKTPFVVPEVLEPTPDVAPLGDVAEASSTVTAEVPGVQGEPS